ncbi:MAG TPA: hypothetical protein VG407_02390 [Caulobacteraceae bacterium]|jgi:hypothetical protein|nr:hypothetical protein [Caulobacteraceae bacterium]
MSSHSIPTKPYGAPTASLLKVLLAPQAASPAPPGGPADRDLLARAAEGYDPAAADAQAEALCADANRKLINPLLKLLRAYRLAVALVLAPTAVAALACALPLDADDEKAAAGLALATTLAPIAAYLIVRLNFLAIHEADYERELLFKLDLGAERRTSAAEFMTLDPDACRRGLQDFAGRTRALIALTRRLDKSSALLAKDVRYLYRAVIALAALLAIGAMAMLGWRAAHHGDWTAIGEAMGAFGAVGLVLTLVLWSARKHIAELLHLLAPPSDSGDAFVVICARILGLLGEVISQNEFLRRS